MNFVIDSNIWIYYFDKTCVEHEKVVKYLESILQNQELVITTIIVVEVVQYLIKRLGPDIGYEKSKIFQLGNFKIIEFTMYDLPAHLEKMRHVSKMGLGGRDATILVCMEKEKIDTLVTHDQDFKKLDEIKIVDPISS